MAWEWAYVSEREGHVVRGVVWLVRKLGVQGKLGLGLGGYVVEVRLVRGFVIWQ